MPLPTWREFRDKLYRASAELHRAPWLTMGQRTEEDRLLLDLAHHEMVRAASCDYAPAWSQAFSMLSGLEVALLATRDVLVTRTVRARTYVPPKRRDLTLCARVILEAIEPLEVDARGCFFASILVREFIVDSRPPSVDGCNHFAACQEQADIIATRLVEIEPRITGDWVRDWFSLNERWSAAFETIPF